MPKISLLDIIDYVGGEKRRPVVEGQAVLNANHIIMCGITESGEDLKFNQLCLQTSNLDGDLHEIEISLIKNKNNIDNNIDNVMIIMTTKMVINVTLLLNARQGGSKIGFFGI